MLPKRARALAAAACTAALAGVLPAAERLPWHQDPLFQEIDRRLADVPAIDNHTHLLSPEQFNPEVDAMLPLGLRSTSAGMAAVLAERYGLPTGTAPADGVKVARAARARMVEERGLAGYFYDHLNYTRTDIALVNQGSPEGTDGRRLRWVPFATDLLYPLPAELLMARNPGARSSITSYQKRLRGWMSEAGLEAPPADLNRYLRFADQTLARWREKGAVAVKFLDAYLRTLRFEDVPEERARRLYSDGLAGALSREDYLAFQDFLARHLFLKAGELKLPVHIHCSGGMPPFLRLQEADVRHLELVLTDPRFFGTSFVLIHGGVPLVEEAAYLAVKPHVWVDVSAQPILFPVPDVAANLRKYLVFAPEKVLFGTDPGNYPSVPVGPEVLHASATRALREALSLALAGLVRDGVVSIDTAVQMGRGVLRDNARRLYGWTVP
jgi:predicted TIM-barrel fold metal-dependent hydrolase